MQSVEFADFMRLPLYFYHAIGIHPFGRNKLSVYHKANFYLGFANLIFTFFSESGYVLVAIRNNEHFIEATMTMSYIGFTFVGIIKIITICRHKLKLNELIQKLETIFPKSVQQQRVYRVHYYLTRCMLITKSFSALYLVLIWTYNLMSIIQYIILKYIQKISHVNTILPYPMYLPWQTQTFWNYMFTYVLQVYAGHSSATGQISNDLLLYAVATQIIMHFLYTAHELTNYESQAYVKGQLNVRAAQQDMQFLQRIICYHNELLRITDMMNDIFGVSLLLNFMTSSFIICFVGFQMTIGVGPELLLKLVLYLVSSLVQVFLICNYSQQLIDASSSVAQAAYNQNWSNAEVRYKKMLLLVLHRAQKPVFLKATDFVCISMVTMTEIMQMSYKFFALLRTIYSK